jgi:SAM-dependent methyltransferase
LNTFFLQTSTDMTNTLHGTQAPSAWVRKWTHLITPQGSVLDVACGAGRHMQFLAEQGHGVTGVDRSPEAIEEAKPWGHAVLADIETGPWPFEDLTFDAVIVTHYLWRDLIPKLINSLAPGGVLLYETFAAGNETVGKPSRPDFLLQPGELLHVCEGLRVVAYEDGFLESPERFVQRIVAVREPTDLPLATSPKRYPL